MAIVLGLTGCVAVTGDDTLTLLDTKLAAQLLRNQVSGEVSSASTEEVSQVADASEACGGDATGVTRKWRSTALIELTTEGAGEVQSIVQTISGGLVAKGWSADPSWPSYTTFRVTLDKRDSPALIYITATEGSADGAGATIFVEAVGPCVNTDGPGSHELEVLGE